MARGADANADRFTSTGTCSRATPNGASPKRNTSRIGHRLQRPEGALDPGEALVGENCRAGIEIPFRHRGTQGIEAVERRLRGDRRLVACEGERGVGDGEIEPNFGSRG